MYAVATETPGVVTLLLTAGADLKLWDKEGADALMFAAEHSGPEVVAALLKAGAKATVKDRKGRKALDHAQRNSRLKGTGAYEELVKASR